MSGRAVIEQVLARAYKARENGDVDGILAEFHPEATFRLAGSPQFAKLAMTATGHVALRAAIRGFIESFDFLRRDLVSTLIDGNQAVVHSLITLRFNPNGKAEAMDFVDIWTFADGKAMELVEFIDTATANAMTGARTS